MGKIQLATAFSCVLIYENVLQKNAGNGLAETQNLKLFWGSMPPDPLGWAAFIATTFLPRACTFRLPTPCMKREDSQMVMYDLWHTSP